MLGECGLSYLNDTDIDLLVRRCGGRSRRLSPWLDQVFEVGLLLSDLGSIVWALFLMISGLEANHNMRLFWRATDLLGILGLG